MIHLLVVLPGADAREPAAPRPSVEVLVARGAEEAVEKLARNRRVDAVLLLSGSENAAVSSAIREDNPSPPPLFAPALGGSIPGVRLVPDGNEEALLDRVREILEGA